MADRTEKNDEELDQRELDRVVGGLGNFETQNPRKIPDPDADDGETKRQPGGKGFALPDFR